MSTSSLPSTFKKLIVRELSTKFRACTSIVEVPLSPVTVSSLKPTELLVRNVYAGVNASDINFTAGTYKKGVSPPFDCGFEAVGVVVGVGSSPSSSSTFRVGDSVVTQAYGGFSEYQVVSIRNAKVAPSVSPKWLALDLSGTTASIALEQIVSPQKGEVALVTAAAGGTGQFAVQLLKHQYQCKVVGTCSSEAKRAMLMKLGCDVVINYKTEDVSSVLQQTFPTGVNVVYESVGGRMMDLALRHLAVKGRICTIGSISGYQDASSWSSIGKQQDDNNVLPIPSQLLMKSASLRGFFLPHFAKHAPRHFEALTKMVEAGVIVSEVDPRMFRGLEQVADAVEYLHSGQNVGKVVVQIAEDTTAAPSKL